MVRVLVTYACKPGKRDALLEGLETAGLIQKCREDKGNIQYEYYRSVDREDELFLYEKWEDDASLDLHMKQPHMLDIRKVIAECADSTDIVRLPDAEE